MLPVEGPVPAADAPFSVIVGLTAALGAAALGECPACHRVADICGNDPEPDRGAFYVYDVDVRVDHHMACPAADVRELTQWLCPPYGTAENPYLKGGS